MIQVEQMSDMELIEDRLEHINNAVNILFTTVERMFQARDKGDDTEITTEMRLLTDIGWRTAAMKICCNKMKAQAEVLKDLESEENQNG